MFPVITDSRFADAAGTSADKRGSYSAANV